MVVPLANNFFTFDKQFVDFNPNISMKNIYTLMLALFAFYFAGAQCDNNRYKNEIFTSTTKTTVVYSTAYNLSMDIYTPDTDTETNRPAILLAHGGSFIGGNRTEATIVELCERFAKRGYVTASMSYRLATNPLAMLQESSAFPVVVKAISDGKAAVRYLKANAATLGIDSNRVIVGGNSAGAILMLHLAYIDDLNEVQSDTLIYNALVANGGFEGNSGNDGPTSKVYAMVDWAGAIKDTMWFNTGNVPVVNLHGDPDGTVPYGCGQVLNGSSQVKVCGPGAYNSRLINQGINFVAKRYPGGDHQPWGSNGTGAVFNECDSITRDFLYSYICENAASVKPVNNDILAVYPNPATESININLANASAYTSVQLLDYTGRVVAEQAINGSLVSIARAQHSAGMYFVRLVKNDNTAAIRKVIFE